jgi:hypothetical protein
MRERLAHTGPLACWQGQVGGRRMIRQMGYDLDRFEQWIAGTLTASLLEPDHG